MSNFEKHFEALFISIKNSFSYKINFFLNILYNILPTFSVLLLWMYIYRGQGIIGYYDRNRMITYYFFMFIVSNLLQVGISEFSYIVEIKNGAIAKYLLRPYRFESFLFFSSFHSVITFIAFFSAPIVFIGNVCKKYLTFSMNITVIFFLIISLVLGYLINFCFKWIVVSLAFYLDNVSTLPKAINLGKQLVGGMIIPLNMLPDNVYSIINLLPFKYLGYYQVSLLVNDLTFPEMQSNIIIEIFWVSILFFLARLLWTNGMKIYSCFGG